MGKRPRDNGDYLSPRALSSVFSDINRTVRGIAAYSRPRRHGDVLSPTGSRTATETTIRSQDNILGTISSISPYERRAIDYCDVNGAVRGEKRQLRVSLK